MRYEPIIIVPVTATSCLPQRDLHTPDFHLSPTPQLLTSLSHPSPSGLSYLPVNIFGVPQKHRHHYHG